MRQIVRDHKGNVYPTKKAMCEHWGIACSNYIQRLYAGWTLKDILTTPVDEDLSHSLSSATRTARQPASQQAGQPSQQQAQQHAFRMSIVPDRETATPAASSSASPAAWLATPLA